ncbi:hypothetical protein [Methylobacterium sp. MA0201]|uniref:hypothetical protein n=1 Tax=Methylobacterium alsaeris TaxID=3344826 RepID=UPI003757AB0A
MAMRREVEEIVTRFGVVGLDQVRSAFGATADVLAAAGRQARQAETDLAAAGAASAKAADAVTQANRRLRTGVTDAEGAARVSLDAMIRQAQEREKAARDAIVAAKAEAEKAMRDLRNAPTGAAAAREAGSRPAAGAAQSQAVQAARDAVAAARARFEQERGLAEASAKAERDEEAARVAAREASLRDELAAIDRRAVARKAATDRARARAAELREGAPAMAARADELMAQARAPEPSYTKIAKELAGAGKSDFEIEQEYERRLDEHRARAKRLHDEGVALSRRAQSLPKLERRARLAGRVDEHGAARDEAARAAAVSRSQAEPVPERETALAAERVRIDVRADARRALLERAREKAQHSQGVLEKAKADEAEAIRQAKAIDRETYAKVKKRAYAENAHAGEDAQYAAFEKAWDDRNERKYRADREAKRRAEKRADLEAAQPGIQRRLSRAEALEAGRAPQEAARRAEIEAEIEAVRAAEAQKGDIAKAAREAKVAEARTALQDAERLLAQETTAAEAAAAAQVRATQKAAAAEAKANRERLKAAQEAAAAAVTASEEQLAATLRANAAAVEAAKAAGEEGIRTARATGAAQVEEAKRALAAAKEVEKQAKEAQRAAREAEQAQQAAAAPQTGAPGLRPTRGTVGVGRAITAADAPRLRREANAAAAAERAAIGELLAGSKAARDQQAAAKAAGASEAELTILRHFEDEKIALLQRTAREAGRTAAEKQRAALAAEAMVQRAAEASSRAQVAAAKAAAKAWEDRGKAVRSASRTLPKLGLLNPAVGLVSALSTRGTLPVAFGFASRAVSAGFGATSAATRALTGTLGLVGRLGAGVGGLGVSAVKAAGHIAYEIGVGAVHAMQRVGAAAVSAGGKILSLGKRLIGRGAALGGVAAIAGAAFARSAIASSTERTGDILDKATDTRSSVLGYQALAGAAKVAGVATKDLDAGLNAALSTLKNLNADPELEDWLNRLGVQTRDVNGRLVDTSQVLTALMPRLRGLPTGEAETILTRVFGSYEAWEKMWPLVRGMMDPNSAAAAAGLQRQARLGSLVTNADVVMTRAWRAAVNDLGDAWTGVKLAVTRAIGAEVIRGIETLAWKIADNRTRVADFAKGLLDLTSVLYRVARDGVAAAGTINPQAFFGRAWFRWAVEGTLALRGFTLAAVDLGREMGRAFQGIREQQAHPDRQVWITARQGVVDLVSVLFYAQRAAAATMPFWRELWATLAGDDRRVTQFPWLISLREGLFTAGRVAREAWFAITGQDARVEEFPILLRLRAGISDAIAWLGAFRREAWAALSGGDAPADARFPWMQAARQAVVDFIQDVKDRWKELGEVWAGGQGETGIGRWFAWVLAKFEQGKKAFLGFVGDVQKIWADLQKVWAGDTGKDSKFNFEFIREAGKKARELATDFKAAFDIVSGIFSGIDKVVRAVSFGHLNAEIIIMSTALASVLGLTRTFGGVLGGLMQGYGKLAGSVAGVSAAVGGAGAAAGGAGLAGAAAAGGGLAAALRGAGSAADAAGANAATAAGKWAKLGEAMRGVGGALSGGKLLGLGAAGVGLSMLAPEQGALGTAMTTAGGALSYGAAGAWAGSAFGPYGTLVGGAAGAAYGAYAGYQSRQQPREQADAAGSKERKPFDVTGGDTTMRPLSEEEIWRSRAVHAEMEDPAAQARYRGVMEMDAWRKSVGLVTSRDMANPDPMSQWAREMYEGGYRPETPPVAPPPGRQSDAGAAANPLVINLPGGAVARASQTDEQRTSLLQAIAGLDGNPLMG